MWDHCDLSDVFPEQGKFVKMCGAGTAVRGGGKPLPYLTLCILTA